MANTLERNSHAASIPRRSSGLWARAVRAVVVAWLTLVSVTSIARAEDIEGFERAMDRGHAELERSQHEAALSAFIEASHLSQCPTGLFWAGKASGALGRKAEAFEFYERAARQTLDAEALAPCVRAKSDADAAAKTSRAQLGWLEVTVLGRATSLTHVELNARRREVADPPQGGLQGETESSTTRHFKIAVDPGSYALVVAGATPVTGTIGAGETIPVKIDLTPEPKPAASKEPPPTESREAKKAPKEALRAKTEPPAQNPPAGTSVWRWTALGAAGAGAILAVASFAVVNNKVDKLQTLLDRRDCDEWCRRDFYDTREDAHTWSTVGNIGGAVGVVGFGAWLWLLATDAKPSESQASAVRWSLTPSSATVAVDW
jgi:hypothetical protein